MHSVAISLDIQWQWFHHAFYLNKDRKQWCIVHDNSKEEANADISLKVFRTQRYRAIIETKRWRTKGPGCYSELHTAAGDLRQQQKILPPVSITQSSLVFPKHNWLLIAAFHRMEQTKAELPGYFRALERAQTHQLPLPSTCAQLAECTHKHALVRLGKTFLLPIL